jgi:hypothetical protein
MGSNSALYVHAGSITSGGTVQKLLSAGALGTFEGAPVTGGILKARKGNTSPLYVGQATLNGGTNGSNVNVANGFELQPGDAVSLDVLGFNSIYIFGATTSDKYDILFVGS